MIGAAHFSETLENANFCKIRARDSSSAYISNFFSSFFLSGWILSPLRESFIFTFRESLICTVEFDVSSICPSISDLLRYTIEYEKN